MGEELGFQIFWHPADAKKAAEQDKEYGDILRVKQARQAFGRIAAQTAKQVLIQRVRDEERDLIFNEFKDRKGELIKGVVRRFEKGNNLIVDLGRTEGILPFREQTPRETYRPGDRIVAYVKDIDREARGPQVILVAQRPAPRREALRGRGPRDLRGHRPRSSPARASPGARSKIAVTSRDADVDPVGACVGMKGARVQAVVQELRGEKIDIVPFDRDPARFVCAAIQPAEVSKVIVDEADGRMELVVPDEKLSPRHRAQGAERAPRRPALGLEARHHQREPSSSRWRRRRSPQLQQIDGVTEAIARGMYRLGFRTLEELAEASEQELAAIPGLGGAEAAARIQHERRDDDGAAPAGAHPARPRRGPSRSPSASACSSSAASASAPSSSSRTRATRRWRTSSARTRTSSPSRRASASRRRAPSSRAPSTSCRASRRPSRRRAARPSRKAREAAAQPQTA